MFNRLSGLILSGLLAVAAVPALAGPTFDAVKARGSVTCGVNTGVYGFSMPDKQGRWAGIDVDLCRAIAVAMFGDAGRTRFVPTTSQNRFAVLQSGEVDVLTRNATQTISRDTQIGITGVGINFYDGQGLMVRTALGVKSARNLDGATICVMPGTTTELNLADYFRANRMRFTPVVIEQVEQLTKAFFSGRCDVLTTDASQLAAIRATEAPNPGDYTIVPEILSKEPLGPMVRKGDEQWAGVVRWTLAAMIEAEEQGVTSRNVTSLAASDRPALKRFLGGLGQGLGLDDGWTMRVIAQVGNYGESFERNLGKGGPIGLDRGLNALWTDGGLMYAIPFR